MPKIIFFYFSLIVWAACACAEEWPPTRWNLELEGTGFHNSRSDSFYRTVPCGEASLKFIDTDESLTLVRNFRCRGADGPYERTYVFEKRGGVLYHEGRVAGVYPGAPRDSTLEIEHSDGDTSTYIKVSPLAALWENWEYAEGSSQDDHHSRFQGSFWMR